MTSTEEQKYDKLIAENERLRKREKELIKFKMAALQIQAIMNDL